MKKKACVVDNNTAEMIAHNAQMLGITQSEYLRRAAKLVNVAMTDVLIQCIRDTGSADAEDFRQFIRTPPELSYDASKAFAAAVLHSKIFGGTTAADTTQQQGA